MIAEIPAELAPLIEAAEGRHPASDGAHRLGWWLAELGVEAAVASQAIARRAAISVETLERFVLGDVDPEEHVARIIAMVTAGAVRAEDWDNGGPLRWQQRPWPRDGGA